MMSDWQFTGAGLLDDWLVRLSRELTKDPNPARTSVLGRALNGIVAAEPFLAAGLFITSPDSGEHNWVQVDHGSEGEDALDQILTQYPDRLTHVTQVGAPVQVETAVCTDDHRHSMNYFIGVPAGWFANGRAGTGFLSARKLNDNELARLEPFSRLLGSLVENARLQETLNQGSEHSSFARLIGLIAHELRTPLTGMRGNIQLALMSNRKGQNDRIPNRLEAAITAVDEMAEMVQKLLDVSRLERGAYEFQDSHVDLRLTMRAAIDDALSHLEQSALQINLTEGAPVEYLHDQNALQQALSYLLQTVARYISEDGEITVAVLHDAGDRRIEISYPGNQFSRYDQSALSAPLHDPPEDNSGQELPLELAFSRGIVSRHNGGIEFATPESSPSTHLITVRLPEKRT